MKNIIFLPLVILLLLSGCKKPEDVITQKNQPSSIDNSSYEAGPGYTGSAPTSKEEYEKVPLYEVITNSPGGRITGAVSVTADLSFDMPPPVDQGHENSCVAFAIGYAMRSYLYHVQTGKSYWSGLNVRDDRSVFSPRFMFNLIKLPPEASDEKGANPKTAIELLVNVGICTWSTSPYVEKQYHVPVTETQRQEAANFKIKSTSYGRVSTKDLLKVKEYIDLKKLPITVALPVDKAFQEPNKNIGNGYELVRIHEKQEICLRKLGKAEGLGHQMVVVGYNDEIKAFKLMNSYGKKWANEGFIWVDYDLFHDFAIDAYFISNSLDGLKQVSAPTGKIDVSFNCDGAPIINNSFGTYTYGFAIHTNNTYDNKLEKFIYLITPDKAAYYKIPFKGTYNTDTFSASVSYAPYLIFGYAYNPLYGTYFENPAYEAYDIVNLLKPTESKSLIKNDYYTPTGIYQFLIVIKNSDGTLTASEPVAFPKPFFDVTSCDGLIYPTKAVSFCTVNF